VKQTCIVMLLCALTGAIGAPGKSAASEAVPFKVGEKLRFDVRYEFVKAGEATLEIPEITECGDARCYCLVSEAKSTMPFSLFFEVLDRVESLFDVDSLYTHRYTKSLKEGKYEAFEQVDFDQAAHKAMYPNGKVVGIPPRVQDVLSSLYYARTLELEVGKSVFIENHADEKNYPLEVRVLRKEEVEVPAGTYECYVLEPILLASGVFQHKGKLTVWISTDPTRIPVMMKSKIVIGSINAVLAEADLGTSPKESGHDG
jgi:hypothetical protein